MTTEPNFRYICENYSGYSKKPIEEQIKEQAELNSLNFPKFKPNEISKGQDLVVYSPGVYGP